MNDQEKINRLVTDVAVIKTVIKHSDERHAEMVENDRRIIERLDSLAVVKTEDFTAYKKQVEDTYVPRTELAGLLKAWSIATNWITRVLVLSLVGLAIWGAVQSQDMTEIIRIDRRWHG